MSKAKYGQKFYFGVQIRVHVDETKLEQIITLPNFTFGQLFM